MLVFFIFYFAIKTLILGFRDGIKKKVRILERERLNSSFSIFKKIFSFLSFIFFTIFLFYFLGNQTWTVRRNPSPCLVNLMDLEI